MLPDHYVTGSDGNLWFTEQNGNRIGRITINGVITEFSLPTADGFPEGIVSAPDSTLWFTGAAPGKMGKMTTAGVITEFNGSGLNITVGPDGNLWFTDVRGIGRMTTTQPGVNIYEFATPTAGSLTDGIAVGPDGNLWFTELAANNIGRITIDGVITEFTIPTAAQPLDIAAGPDGNLWFAEQAGTNIARITTFLVVVASEKR